MTHLPLNLFSLSFCFFKLKPLWQFHSEPHFPSLSLLKKYFSHSYNDPFRFLPPLPLYLCNPPPLICLNVNLIAPLLFFCPGVLDKQRVGILPFVYLGMRSYLKGMGSPCCVITLNRIKQMSLLRKDLYLFFYNEHKQGQMSHYGPLPKKDT